MTVTLVQLCSPVVVPGCHLTEFSEIFSLPSLSIASRKVASVTVSCFIISQLLSGTRSESQLSSPLKRYQNRNATMLPHCAHTGQARPIQAPFGNYRSNKSQRQWQWQRLWQMQLGVHILLSGRTIYVCQIIIPGVLSLRAQCVWGRGGGTLFNIVESVDKIYISQFTQIFMS